MPMFSSSLRSFFLLAVALWGRQSIAAPVSSASLHGGIAPDQRSEVRVVQVPRGHRGEVVTLYQIVGRVDHKVRWSVRSNYQSDPRDPDEPPGYWWDLAKNASVFWNPDSSLVAVDEYPLHSGGEVWLVVMRAGGHARTRQLPVAEILARSGRRWSKVRFRVRQDVGKNGWITPHRLVLNLAGSSPANDPHPRTQGSPDYQVILEVAPGLRAAKIVSVEEGRSH